MLKNFDPPFIDVHVSPCAASEDGVSMRFKRAGDPRPLTELAYESEEGKDGLWRIFAVGDDDAHDGPPALAVPVEDSSDGIAWLIVGGAAGLRLEHVETSAIERQPYLLLAIGTLPR